jgi:hypothetical protein
MTTLSYATTRKQPSFPAYLRLTRLPSTLTSTNQEVVTATGDKLKILGRGNFLMRLDDTKDMVVQALVAQNRLIL